VFEDSHLPLRLWRQAIHLSCTGKKGITTRQLQRALGRSMKTAWHLGQRIRRGVAPGTQEQSGGKLGLVGTYRRVNKKHLNHYPAEFDFKQNARVAQGIDDIQRSKTVIRGMGEQFMYRDLAPAEE